MPRHFLSVALVLALTPLAPRMIRAGDVDSGPDVGKKVPPLKVYALTGNKPDAEIEYSAERKDAPTMYILLAATRWNRPTARFVRQLDEAVAKMGGEARVVAVWLTNDDAKTRELLASLQKAFNLTHTALCTFPNPGGPEHWSISDRADVTVVIVADGKVLESGGYITPNDALVPTLETAFRKTIKQ